MYNCRQSERKPNYFDVFLNMHYLLKKYLWVVARIHIVLICNMESLWFVIINFLLLIMYSAVSLYFCSFSLGKVLSLLWIIIKVISIVPIQHTRWEPRSIYSNTNNTHTNTQMGDRHGCEKDRQCMNMQTDRHSAPHVCVGCHTCCRTSGSWQLPSLRSCCRRWHHRPGSPMTCPHSYLITATRGITVIWSQQHIGLHSHLITAKHRITQSPDHSNT